MRLFATSLILLTFAMLTPAAAKLADALFAGEARVDVLASNPEEARVLAFEKARRLALENLLEKFVPEHKDLVLVDLKNDSIIAMARNIEVVTEMIDGNRYRADLRVNFSARSFNDLVTKKLAAVRADEELATVASLVLPIVKRGDSLFLFEASNDWAAAWRSVVISQGGGLILAPYGDSIDYKMITAERVLEAKYDELLPLLRRYGVRDAVILYARFKTITSNAPTASDQEAPKKLEVMQRRVQAASEEVSVYSYLAGAHEEDKELLVRAGRDIASYITVGQQETIDVVGVRKQHLRTQLIVLPITTMQHYDALVEKLNQTEGIAKVRIVAMTAKQADLEILYSIEKSLLKDALDKNGIKLTDEENYWRIEP